MMRGQKEQMHLAPSDPSCPIWAWQTMLKRKTFQKKVKPSHWSLPCQLISTKPATGLFTIAIFCWLHLWSRQRKDKVLRTRQSSCGIFFRNKFALHSTSSFNQDKLTRGLCPESYFQNLSFISQNPITPKLQIKILPSTMERRHTFPFLANKSLL